MSAAEFAAEEGAPPTDSERPDAPGSTPSAVAPDAGESVTPNSVFQDSHPINRRRFLKGLGLGAGTVAVAAAGGLTWRAVDQGVFAAGTGPAYAAWDEWNPPGHSTLDLVRASVLAANAHNTQPWLFRITPARIDLFAVPDRNIGTIDPLRREMYVSLGCALENLVLAGPPNGKAPAVTLMPDLADPTHVAQVDLASTTASTSPLFDAMHNRHTDRAAYDTSRPISQATLDALKDLIDVPAADVVWFTSPQQKRAFGELVVKATEAIVADPQQSIDDFAWYRGSWSEIQSKMDGVTSDAAGLSPLLRTLAKLLPTSREQNDDSWLKATRDTQVPTAAAFGTLVVRDPLDPAQRLQAGRIWQRMHLEATIKGLAMQPLNQIEERMDREQSAELAPEFTDAMTPMLSSGWHPVFSFRTGYPTVEAPPSPRRPAEEVVRR